MQHRRNRTEAKRKTAQSLLADEGSQAKLTRLKARIEEESSGNQLSRTILAIASSESLDDRFAAIEKSDKVEALLLELKEGQSRLSNDQ